MSVVSIEVYHQCARKSCYQEMLAPAGSGTFCILELLSFFFFFSFKVPTFLAVLMVQVVTTHEKSEKEPGKSFCCLHSCSVN